MNNQQLDLLGVDRETAVNRFGGRADLYDKFLYKFLEDPTFGELRAAVAAGDAKQGFLAAHTLKGVAGNLSMDTLFRMLHDVVEDLRAGSCAVAAEQMPALEAHYEALCAAIRAGDRPDGIL